MDKNGCDVLSLEWSSKGRDIHIVEPVLNYIELKHLVVERGCIFNYKELIIKYKPQIVILSNGVGDKINNEVVKFSKALNLKVVTLISEGDFPDDINKANEFMWGWNKEKRLIEDLHLQWSSKNLDIIRRYCDADMDKIKVVGATGFDRYALMKCVDKFEFLNEIDMSNYSKIVGYAGWGFDIEDPEGIYQKNIKNKVSPRFNKKELFNLSESRYKVNKMLHKVIEKNKDILFILKMHPGSIQEELTEFNGVEKYENVLFVRGHEMEILTAISVSDIWLAFESTSCLEAWLMNKITGILKPVENDFERSIISTGSPEIKSFEELNDFIIDFYKNDCTQFSKLEDTRSNIITQIIENRDGLNHVRAGVEIIKLLNFNKSSDKTGEYSLFYYKKMMIYYLEYALKSRFLSWIPIVEKYHNYIQKLSSIYDSKERDQLKKMYMDFQVKYYSTVVDRVKNIENP